MADVLTIEQRKHCMSRIRYKDTSPEKIVRIQVSALGYRYRLHQRDLPGCPDLVFSKLKKVIFVHGCFWHRHHCRFGKVSPKTNASFWSEKIAGNVTRDRRNYQKLWSLGWRILTLWECQLRDQEKVQKRLKIFLEN